MKKALIVCAATLLAMPVASVASTADAQVLAGRNAARADRSPRVTREERLSNLRFEAEERLAEVEERIAEIEASVQASGAATPAQTRQLEQLASRKAREEREIARLTAALEP